MISLLAKLDLSKAVLPLAHTTIVPLKYIEYMVYRDLITIYPKPYSIYLRGTILRHVGSIAVLGMWNEHQNMP